VAVTHDTWSDYWRLGELTTLNYFRDGYTGELARFWHELVDALPDGARVLDLATGNGAVALAVLRHARSQGRVVSVEGVDAAQIDPPAHASRSAGVREELQAIRFHSGTPLERTGLPAAHYHLVTSQYGVEYGDLEAAVVEIARLLLPGGRFGAILHSADSNVARTAANIDALLSRVLGELAIPDLVRRLLARTGDVRDAAGLARTRADPATAALWLELQRAAARGQAMAAHDEQMRGTMNGFLHLISAPFDQAIGSDPPAKLAMVDQVERKSRGLLQRMAALRACALDRHGLERFLERLRRAGVVPEPARTIHFGPLDEPMGYGVVARRS
jgi:SAM-dependent methyltransferase